MKRFDATIDFIVPDEITEEQFEEWFRYRIVDYDGCSGDNPLLERDINSLVSTYHIREW